MIVFEYFYLHFEHFIKEKAKKKRVCNQTCHIKCFACDDHRNLRGTVLDNSYMHQSCLCCRYALWVFFYLWVQVSQHGLSSSKLYIGAEYYWVPIAILHSNSCSACLYSLCFPEVLWCLYKVTDTGIGCVLPCSLARQEGLWKSSYKGVSAPTVPSKHLYICRGAVLVCYQTYTNQVHAICLATDTLHYTQVQ